MSSFENVVNRETVASFGIDMSIWGDEQENLLHESMILAWKENPDWTEKEAKHACLQQVMGILEDWFTKNMGFLVMQCNHWYSVEEAFEEFVNMSLKEFICMLNKQMEFTKFCTLFYDELRERYNICSAGMQDEFERMKANKWSFNDYKKDLKKRK